MSAQLTAPPSSARSPWGKVLLACGAFSLVSWPVGFACRALFPGVPWLPQTTVKVVLLGTSIAATLAGGRSLSEMGFRPATSNLGWKAMGVGLALGTIANVVMLVSGAHGFRPFMMSLSFGQIVLTVWIVSSVAEEVFCRGWFQTWVLGPNQQRVGASGLMLSAVVFGAMHLGLLASGIDARSVVILVPMVTVLGWVCSWARARSGSLYPAIAAHVAFNVGGMIGGVLYGLIAGDLAG